MGAFSGGSIVVASMVGAGIFTAAGYAAEGLEHPITLLVLWGVGGLYSLCGALCYAELGSRFPEAGGEYAYLREAYGPPVAFLSGWISFVAGFSGAIAVFSLALVAYLDAILTFWDAESVVISAPSIVVGGREVGPWEVTWGRVAAMGIVVVSTMVHCRRFSVGIVYQNLLTALKVLAMALFIAGGLVSWHANWGVFGAGSGSASAVPDLPVLAGCFAAVLFSYSGWNAAAYLGEELKNPGKTLVRALVGGTLVVTALYLLFNLVYVLAMPLGEFGEDKRIAFRAATVLLGSDWARVLAAAFGVLLLATVGANIMTGPRVYFAMARDGLFPRSLCGGINRWGVPQRAVLLQGFVAVFLLLVGGFQQLLYWVTFVINVFATLAVLSLAVVRWQKRGEASFRVPLYPLPLLVFCAISGFFGVWVFMQFPETSRWGLVLIEVGAVVYVLWAVYSWLSRRRGDDYVRL